MRADFLAFLTKTGALALAIGVVIGAALGVVVTSLVNDIIMPPIGLALGGIDFRQLRIVLRAAVGGDPATEVAIRYGAFLNAVLAFIIIAFVVWRLSKLFIREAAAEPSKTCPFCRQTNAVDASKCMHCASPI